MKLSKEQKTVQTAVLDWYKNGLSNVIKVVGYAGTGKTTLMTKLSNKIRANKDMGRSGARRIAFCAFTGKASFVLENKLNENGTLTDVDYVGTIHGLLYTPIYKRKNGKKIIIGWERKRKLEYDLIIVDEGSMITKELWKDLTSYRIPIIVSGDHGQLPPVGPKFNLLENAHLKLNEIHRQALNNPIIQLTIDIRRKGYIDPGIYNESVFKLDWNNENCKNIYHSIVWDEDAKDIIQLCGFNNTRVTLNNIVRKKLSYKLPTPYPGERIICLKNNHDTGIKNGQLGTLKWVYPAGDDLFELTMKMDGYGDNLHQSLSHKGCFGQSTYNHVSEIDFKKQYARKLKEHKMEDIDLFDFGYATTVHKSQGSEWNKVVLFEQRNKYQTDIDYARWLYTAATRAKEKLFIIYNYWG